MFETITRERRRREVEPIIETIQRCRADIEHEIDSLDGETRKQAEDAHKKLSDMLDFINAMNTLLNTVLSTGSEKIGELATLLAAVGK
jgi:DNA-binding transcriptional regulator GbsR (MarR family)